MRFALLTACVPVACDLVNHSEHVWLERGQDACCNRSFCPGDSFLCLHNSGKDHATQSLDVGETVMIRWSHFVGENKGWYSWGYVRDSSSGNFLDSITGNTKATGTFEWQVPQRMCGKHIQVEMCSGSPPRKTKHACHKSQALLVKGSCEPESESTPVLTTTTTSLAHVRELGPMSLRSRSRHLKTRTVSQGFSKDEAASDATACTDDGAWNHSFSVALIVVWLGPLPDFVGAFAETAQDSGVTFFVFHTRDEEPPQQSDRVHFKHLPLQSLAMRLWKADVVQKVFGDMSFGSFEDRVKECYADDNPAKGNDLKPLYGALFQEELQPYTHWGWTDLDMIWGRLDSFLTPQVLSSYDVVSAPDGARPALYLSGQLTIFQNNELWRRFIGDCIRGEGHVNYGGCYVEGLLSEANLFFDEKLAIWYAALREARIWVDFSWLLVEPRWSRLSGRQVQKLTREAGRLLVHGSQGLPFADIERWNMEVHELQNRSDCYTEFGLGWSFVCVPSEGGDAFGVAYEVDTDRGLFLWPSPPHSVDGGVEFAALHLHRSKQGFQWESCPSKPVTCQKEVPSSASAGSVRCSCGSVESSTSWELPIPNVVHFVLTDRNTRFFDWPCYVAIRSAWEKLQPDKLLVHVLDGVEPGTFNDWWQAAKAFVTAVIPFPRSAVPYSLNGIRLSHPAFIADFQRIQILYAWGGIYMDTDALSLRSFEELRRWKAVLARQGGIELRATVGLMMFEKHSPLLLPLLDRMKRAYTGSWGVHAGQQAQRFGNGLRHMSLDRSTACHCHLGTCWMISWQVRGRKG